MRVNSPPSSCCFWSNTNSLSTVTVLATSLPPGRRADQQVSRRLGIVKPPPIKIASGIGKSLRIAGAVPAMIWSWGVPRAVALSAIYCKRWGCCSMAIARQCLWLRSHSILMEPHPAPTSHNSCPGRGARAAKVIARTSRLVSWPSWW